MRPSIALLCALILASGCSSWTSDEGDSEAPPAPDLAAFLHENYSVVSQFPAQLVEGEPDSIVVISRGPGLTPGAPIPGGTEDVQVLAYDDHAERWVLAFDAADQLSSIGQIAGARPLLDQTHPIEDATAQLVHFRGRPTADLVVAGVDNFTNHPSNDVAIVRFGVGTAELAWTSDEIGTPTPLVEGEVPKQTVSVEAAYYTDFDALCCPVRQYTRRLDADDDGNIVVVDDDRPYLGTYIMPLDPVTAGAAVLGVEPGSPAAGVLRPGDRLLAIDGDSAADNGDDVGLPLLRVLANKEAGQEVTIRFQRTETIHNVAIELASIADAPEPSPGAGQLGVNVHEIAGGFEITSVNSGSPADHAGLNAGDRLLTVNRRPIKEYRDFYIALWQTRESVPVTYVDPSGVTRTVQVTPEATNDGPTTGRL